MYTTFAECVTGARTARTSEDDYAIVRALAQLDPCGHPVVTFYVRSAAVSTTREDDYAIVQGLAERDAADF